MTKQKQEYRGMFETQKSRNKTSSGDIGLNIRTRNDVEENPPQKSQIKTNTKQHTTIKQTNPNKRVLIDIIFYKIFKRLKNNTSLSILKLILSFLFSKTVFINNNMHRLFCLLILCVLYIPNGTLSWIYSYNILNGCHDCAYKIFVKI